MKKFILVLLFLILSQFVIHEDSDISKIGIKNSSARSYYGTQISEDNYMTLHNLWSGRLFPSWLQPDWLR